LTVAQFNPIGLGPKKLLSPCTGVVFVEITVNETGKPLGLSRKRKPGEECKKENEERKIFHGDKGLLLTMYRLDLILHGFA
jgi:hypothetical protein